MSHYLPPGLPPPPPPPARANSYLVPTALAPQMRAPPDPPPQQPALTPGNGHDDRRHSPLLNEWRRQHGSGWVRGDALHPVVRELIDARGRVAAVRQKLRQLVAACPELEAKVAGNAARPVVFYRVTEVEAAGLEG